MTMPIGDCDIISTPMVDDRESWESKLSPTPQETQETQETQGTQSPQYHSPSVPQVRTDTSPEQVSEKIVLDDSVRPPSTGGGPQTRRRHGLARRKQVRVHHLPWRQRPSPNAAGEWLPEKAQVTPWMSLFYDLVVVAVLNTFSNNHELRTPDVIVPFLSYYVVIISVWVSQIHYDTRYEGEDNFHRICKAAQIALFAYNGAASGGWDLSHLQWPSGESRAVMETQDVVAHEQARTAFVTTVISVILTRVLLVVQYTFVVFSGKAVKRSVHRPVLAIVWLATSILCLVIAAAVPPTTHASAAVKIAFFYIGLGIELLATWITSSYIRVDWFPEEQLAERYGSLTLMIIGEGFIGLVSAVAKGIQNLHIRDPVVYAQAFLMIVIMFNLWIFMFQNFRKSDTVGAPRTTLWEIIHVPLHFAMLLLLAAMVNTIIEEDFIVGIGNVSNFWFNVTDALRNQKGASEPQYETAASYLQRLNLDPDFHTMYGYLQELYNNPNRTLDPEIMGNQYFAAIIKSTSTSAGLSFSNKASTLYGKLNYMDDTYTTNLTDLDIRQTQAVDYLVKIFGEVTQDALSGTLWLFPSAGVTVFLSGVRSIIRYRFHGAVHYVLHFGQMLAGVALSFLGFLDLGEGRLFNGLSLDDGFDINTSIKPIYELTEANWSLAVITLVYCGVTAASMAAVWITERAERKKAITLGPTLTEDQTGEDSKTV